MAVPPIPQPMNPTVRVVKELQEISGKLDKVTDLLAKLLASAQKTESYAKQVSDRGA